MNFERTALGVIGTLTAVLVIVASFNPPKSGTALLRANFPRVSLADAESLPLSAGPVLATVKGSLGLGVVAGSARALSNAFERIGYRLDKVIAGEQRVPRLFLASLPGDIGGVVENKARKALFFSSVLPLVLQVNEEIATDRGRLWKLRYRVRLGEKLAAADRLWLTVMGERYRTKAANMAENINRLIDRVDIIPPSLALAQAAEESGWGTSRFAREGNAIFGQWTFKAGDGLQPADRDAGKKHSVRAFANLTDSVRAYALNLNSHRAYRGFRKMRAMIRRQGAPLDGRLLAGWLQSYSQRGSAYVSALRGLIDGNLLQRLDDARLHSGEHRPTI